MYVGAIFKFLLSLVIVAAIIIVVIRSLVWILCYTPERPAADNEEHEKSQVQVVDNSGAPYERLLVTIAVLIPIAYLAWLFLRGDA